MFLYINYASIKKFQKTVTNVTSIMLASDPKLLDVQSSKMWSITKGKLVSKNTPRNENDYGILRQHFTAANGLDDLQEEMNIMREIKDINMELLELKIHYLKFKIHWMDLPGNWYFRN